MANSLPITAAQPGPTLRVHCSQRFLSHSLHEALPGRSDSFVEHWLDAVAGRSRCEHNRVFPCQTSSMLAPIRRSTVEPMHAYGTEYQLRAYATWLLACTLRPYTRPPPRKASAAT